jgi:hypothetical protein
VAQHVLLLLSDERPRLIELAPMTPAVFRGEAVQEIFNLDEGPVTLTVPATLSPESYQDMADRIEIFLRGLKRRSEAAARRIEHGDDALLEAAAKLAWRDEGQK